MLLCTSIEGRKWNIFIMVVFAIEAPRLTNVVGQKVVPRNFIFPPSVHLLHLGAKNTAFQ